MTSANAAAIAPCSITYTKSNIGMSALPSAYAINMPLWRHEPTKPIAAASIVSAPRVGVTIAAAPAATPANIGCHCHRLGLSTPARTAQAAIMENSVVNQWWLICVQAPCDMTAHPIARSAEDGACLDT